MLQCKTKSKGCWLRSREIRGGHPVTVQHVSCLRMKLILYHFKYCARGGTRKALNGGHGGQALLLQKWAAYCREQIFQTPAK